MFIIRFIISFIKAVIVFMAGLIIIDTIKKPKPKKGRKKFKWFILILIIILLILFKFNLFDDILNILSKVPDIIIPSFYYIISSFLLTLSILAVIIFISIRLLFSSEFNTEEDYMIGIFLTLCISFLLTFTTGYIVHCSTVVVENDDINIKKIGNYYYTDSNEDIRDNQITKVKNKHSYVKKSISKSFKWFHDIDYFINDKDVLIE